jgi:hypothetical protein
MSDVLSRLRAREAEVWIRLRPPTTLEAVGRGLQEEMEPDDALLELCEWIVNRHSETTWDLSADDLRDAARQLVRMVAPVLGDRAEVARRIDAWAEEWSLR